jgi:hypothetical protein
MWNNADDEDAFRDWEMLNGTGSTTLWTVAYRAPRFGGAGFRREAVGAQLERERRLCHQYVRQEKVKREIQGVRDGIKKSSLEGATKAERSRELAAQMASDSLHGVQPRNAHHRSLRGFSDAPRRPVYRGSR